MGGPTHQTGVSGSSGGSDVPYVYEQQTRAASYFAHLKQGLISPDQLDDLTFSQTKSAQDAWKYQTDARSPWIGILTRLRADSARLEPATTSWVEEMSRLLEFLPPEVREKLVAQSALPPELRDPAYMALDSVLANVAQGMTWINAIAQPVPPMAEAHKASSAQLPQIALNNLISNSAQILDLIESRLNEVGHQNPNFDQLSSLSSQMREVLGRLQSMQQEPGDSDGFARLSSDLNLLLSQAQSKSFGNDLQVITPTLESMSLMTNALSMKTEGALSFLGMSIAAIGLNKEDSPVGVIPDAIAHSIEQLAEGLSPLLPNADPGTRQMLPTLLTGMALAATALTINADPIKTDLALSFIHSSGLLSTLASSLAKASGANEATLPGATQAISLATMLMTIQGVAVDHPATALRIVDSLRSPLTQWLNNVIEEFNRNENLGEIPSFSAILSQQALTALEKHDDQAFLDTLDQWTEHESSEINLKEALKDLKQFIALINKNASDNQGTGEGVDIRIIHV